MKYTYVRTKTWKWHKINYSEHHAVVRTCESLSEDKLAGSDRRMPANQRLD